MKAVRALACLAGLLVLAGCGGGGGGGSDGGPKGSLTLSTSTLTFQTAGTQTPASQNVTATIGGNVGETVYLRIVATGTAVSRIDNIVVTSNTTGQGTVVPASAATLGPGVHTATITVTACTSNAQCASGVIGSPQTIAVTYTISGVAASTAPLTYSVGFNPVAADLTKTLAVDAHPSFTASTNVNWLAVSPATGGSGRTQMNVNLVSSAVDALASGDHTGTVTLTAPAGPPVQVPVTLTITKPQLDRAVPYVAGVNQSATVTVRGLFVNQLSDGSVVELVDANGGTHALTNTYIVDSTTLEITHPALPAGSYQLRMRNAQGQVIDRSTARLLVVDNTIYASQFIPWPVGSDVRYISSVMFDSERRTLRLAGRNGATVDDFAMLSTEYDTSSSSWNTVTISPYRRLDNVVLSADGMTLLTSSSESVGGVEYASIAQLSPITLVEQTAFVSTIGHSNFPRPAVTSANEVMVVRDSPDTTGGGPLQRYSLRANTLTAVAIPPGDIGAYFYQARVAASGNGQRVLVGSSNSDTPVYEYAVSSGGELSRTRLTAGETDEIEMDRKGEMLLIRYREFLGPTAVRIYDRSWNDRGEVPVANYGYVLSPDGTYAYGYEGQGDQLHVYDLTAPRVGNFYPEAQTITLAGDPSPLFQSTDVAMTLSPDGKVLFIASSGGIVVQPLP